ncbi:diadenylate cyclase CdaA [Fodinibius sp. SL11]|uniref:diadenylate cyclase CdaA n=1 Tax=Fodinibius sp. SL11 TaxID=3425690 RepID=UPI003F88271D
MIPIGFLEFGIRDFIEVLIITMVLFYLYRWIRGTFAIQAAVGLVFIIIINAAVSALGLTTINFILRAILDVGILAVFIIFQPEIRKLLYSLGQNTNLDRFFVHSNSDTIIDEVVDAVRDMSHTKTGALIVFARSSTLQDLVDVGVKLDAKVNSELLKTIFNKNTPLHDGAIVIRNNRIVAASCYLPISQNQNISSVFGTRHRAAVGITETNNVFVVVVSEESGRISIAKNGSLTSGLTIQKLRSEMQEALGEHDIDEDDVAFSSAQSELKLS